MKIAISSKGKDLDSDLDDVFGRCHYFIIAELKNGKIKKVETIENTSAKQMGGAGISAAQKVAEKDVSVVITGNIGPRALDVLKQFNIEIYNGSGLIKEILQKFIEGKLEKISK
jgi:predicted Fe-Mo cluster-binding NifX family protein